MKESSWECSTKAASAVLPAHGCVSIAGPFTNASVSTTPVASTAQGSQCIHIERTLQLVFFTNAYVQSGNSALFYVPCCKGLHCLGRVCSEVWQPFSRGSLQAVLQGGTSSPSPLQPVGDRPHYHAIMNLPDLFACCEIHLHLITWPVQALGHLTNAIHMCNCLFLVQNAPLMAPMPVQVRVCQDAAPI